ncbi:MAG: hypothetical protein C4289_03900 [Chloroflexota bacterium]
MDISGVDPLLAGIGLLVGFLIGRTGMGGGAIMALLLILLGIRPLTVVGTDPAYATLTKIAGAAYHWRRGTVHLPIVRALAGMSLSTQPQRLAGRSRSHTRAGARSCSWPLLCWCRCACRAYASMATHPGCSRLPASWWACWSG